MSDARAAALPRFTSFVMLAEMRTGSNFLEANLNALNGVRCLGEMFNPNFIGGPKRHEAFGHDMEAREKDPLGLLRAMHEQTPGLSGFRYFHDHDARILPAVMEDAACAKIILTRNPLESYISWQIARETDQWRLSNVKNLKTAQAEFNASGFEEHLETVQDFQIRLMHMLQVSGQTAFYIDYEDISDVAVLNGLAAWLGVSSRLEAVDNSLVKQNPGALSDKVRNPGDMEQALARLDRFNLARTPNFEPRRSAGVPSFIGSDRARLLYMPIKGGPVPQVSAWLEALGDVTGDFTRKSLRNWEQTHPGNLAFTVLRHPLLRAHTAFLDLIVSGRLKDHRNALMRAHGADLPPKGEGFADPDQHRAAFLAFLRYAKLSVNGQTGQRVDPHWASQNAVLQGFAGLRSPDLILREERLASGLGWLSSELGFTAPPFTPDPEQARALASVWSEELDTAAQEAWPRDYSAFGFSRWQA
ncbi:sulfotransferase family 2 domain-containing protein [Pseudogemmobacter bohemicus]|uniref:sulfotransferase family 2 domain-containing protein n=1 Tax=Pseudogemmobacter bohemicus TaxID=2250708 RepID=UPI000DD33C69|nr:sulfotransferase family 2 domain-containing protein [Pseudogemmobacter bohemicus]